MTSRARAIDAVRGVAMVVMAFDHLRDFLGHAHFDATDLTVTTPGLFLSRWVTHFCAPTFFWLAGGSAWLSLESKRRTTAQATRFLVSRGLALVLVEQTLLRCFGWYFHFDYHFMNAGVLYGLGWSMVALALFLHVPPAVSLVIGLAIILGEQVIAQLDFGPGLLGTLVALATQSRDFEPMAGYHFFVSYPPLPWFGPMAFGYGLFHFVFHGNAVRRWPLALGALSFFALFVLARALGLGDPTPWSSQPDTWRTVFAFVNVAKYPPSTTFLLLTLSVAMLGVLTFDRWPTLGRPFETFGRVPLFFYLLHIPLIHALAVLYSLATFGAATWLLSGPVIFWDTALPGSPADYGLSLGAVWAVWALFIAALAPVCRWHGARGSYVASGG
jgi:uncharacterized membrane protein